MSANRMRLRRPSASGVVVSNWNAPSRIAPVRWNHPPWLSIQVCTQRPAVSS